MMGNTVIWGLYPFQICEYSGQWNNAAGIYIFAGANQQNQWIPYYIGQAGSFADRIPSHEQWDKAELLGATHVHALVVPQAAMRDKIEAELIQQYQPQLNVQLR